jgi:protocatechuate 3,4-dioxygenase beta subunit
MIAKKDAVRRMGRRDALGAIGPLGAAIVLRCGGSDASAAGTETNTTDGGGSGTSGADAGALDCVVDPALTEGPFFVDEKLNRSDLTAGTSEPFVVNGTPFRLQLGVYAVSAGVCTALSGAQVDVWHASAEGVYSDEASGTVQSKSTVGEKYLRGYQITDSTGQVAFTTIYPGWYQGRTIHIHFKIRTFSSSGAQTYEFTSQLFVDDAVNDVVLATAPYNTRGARSVRNANDGIYTSGGAGSVLTLDVEQASSGTGYVGTFNIGLRMS